MNRSSYSARMKDTLCKRSAHEFGLDITPGTKVTGQCGKCCAMAFFYGVTLFSRRLQRDTMTLTIENETLLEICTYILIHHFLAAPDVRQITKSGKTRFEVTFGRELVGTELYERLCDEDKDLSFACSCEDCPRYFIRGAFLASGTISDPEVDYRAEFILKEGSSAKALADFLGEEFAPKVTKRRADYVLYIKGRTRVETLCTVIGAEAVSLDIMLKSIEKERMNDLNRTGNFESANMSKTVNASVSVRLAIKKLRESGRFDTLPPDLREIAELREEYPEASLTLLASLCKSGLSRSGINHKLKKLVELSEE